LALKLLIVGPNFTLKVSRERRLLDPGADLLAACRKGSDVARVQALEALVDPLAELAGAQELAEGVGSGGEAAGNADAGVRQRSRHFAQRGVLAADLRKIRKAQIF
jgi:hypothetical protein